MTMAPTDDPEAETFTARALACAVIGLAWQDAFARADSGWSEPRQFFERDSPIFRLWCAWAGVDPDAVREAFRRRMAAGAPVSAPKRQRKRRTRYLRKAWRAA